MHYQEKMYTMYEMLADQITILQVKEELEMISREEKIQLSILHKIKDLLQKSPALDMIECKQTNICN